MTNKKPDVREKPPLIEPYVLQEMWEKWFVEKEELLKNGKYPEKGFAQIVTEVQSSNDAEG